MCEAVLCVYRIKDMIVNEDVSKYARQYLKDLIEKTWETYPLYFEKAPIDGFEFSDPYSKV